LNTTTDNTKPVVPNLSTEPRSLSDSDIPFGIRFWKIGEWVIHVISWVLCGLSFYWIRNAVDPIVFIIMLILFFRLEYNMIFKNKKGF
jgi:hypothetical protein